MIIEWLSFPLFFCFLITGSLHSQPQYGMGKKQEILDAYTRLALKYDTIPKPLKTQNLNRISVAQLANIVDLSLLTEKDSWDLDLLKSEYNLLIDVSPSGLNDHSFFKNGHLFSFQNKDISLQIDPLLYLAIGDDRHSTTTPFRNSRGLSIRGNINKKVFFRTSIIENQAKFLPHIEKRIVDRNAIPGQGFYKRYQSNIFKKINGWDFLNADGILTYQPSTHFRASIGHGSFFLGNGYHSLLLSDYADNYFFLEFNTSIGIFNYKNIFAELAPIGSTIDVPGDLLAPKKYMATHYLTIAISKKLELSLFETVIFGRKDHFEFQYLNPLILYRVVEQKLDSPDNVMLGFDMNYKIGSKTKIYGQLLIDEMKTGEIFSGNGWWGNKIGYQLGYKQLDLFGIDHFDIQMEYNAVRPFTYSHKSSPKLDYSVASYSHYNLELAHPLGANFREGLLLLKYRINRKWSLSGKLITARVGKSISENIGQDILLPNDTRVNDFSNKIGQGDKTNILQLSTILSYEIRNNYYADFHFQYRKEQSNSGLFNEKSTYFCISFRANISHQKLDY
ncbi:MAG: hypothetical protein V3V00_00675 [Saprospiraceae bacterium]